MLLDVLSTIGGTSRHGASNLMPAGTVQTSVEGSTSKRDSPSCPTVLSEAVQKYMHMLDYPVDFCVRSRLLWEAGHLLLLHVCVRSCASCGLSPTRNDSSWGSTVLQQSRPPRYTRLPSSLTYCRSGIEYFARKASTSASSRSSREATAQDTQLVIMFLVCAPDC